MHLTENKSKKTGEIMSYRFAVSGRDPMTGGTKLYTTTWQVPYGLSKKDIKHELLKAQFEYEKYVGKVSAGIQVEENYITFKDFANQWHEEILIRNEESYNYYLRTKENLKVIMPFFEKYLLRNISPSIVQEFYNYLCTRTYTKQVVKVKKSINELLDQQALSRTKIANELGMARLTLRLASRVGNPINMETARTIAKYFNVPVERYFEVTKIESKYAKETNASIRTTLSMILGEAKRRRLVDHNFASKEFTKPISGTTKEKEIFDEDEAREFVRLVINEEDLRKKTALSLLIFMALRRAEIVGLRWQDIDFENKTLSVNQNTIYAGKEFGVKTKSPKTENSQRTISMPDMLVEILKEYKQVWDNQKVLHGDLWENADRLFLQYNGKPMNPCTLGQWVTDFENKHGLKHVPCHSLRHTAISLQIMANIPLKVVSERAGHANEKITLAIYTHTLKSQDKQASVIYNNFLCGVN